MENINYKSIVTEEIEGKFVSEIKMLNTRDLPSNDVLIKVKYSSINYKDALSASGNKGVTKKYPHTSGIDAAGIVVQSNVTDFKPGDEVIVTGYDLGMNTPGGFGQYICVPAEWVILLPENLSLKESMIIGTAGFTAGISVRRLSELVKPADGKIVVSGATGGVGSVAVSILSQLGYQVVAVSGKESEYEYLKNLGASEIIPRNDFQVTDSKPVSSARFAGGIDTVGGPILENIIKSLSPLGAVTTCGSVSSTQLNLSVFPFILRGISLIGISAQNYPMPLRKSLWDLLSQQWKPTNLMEIYTEISLNEVVDTLHDILNSKLKGRTIVNLDL
ncbi:MAG TPA: YhdH/YhfP family quinone oxidoreductase [Paludibacter sp.]|nr:YhdH/YhfP family quinone oxidoreductase [Paludibacter sp.]